MCVGSTCGVGCSGSCVGGCGNTCVGNTCGVGCTDQCNDTCKETCRKNCASEANLTPIGYTWDWSFPITSGSAFALTAYEWKNFLNFINEAREYVGDSAVSFDMRNISSGKAFTEELFNEARSAISTATGHGTLPPAAVTGEPIIGGASGHFGRIRDSINETASMEVEE